ncbi:hypothetical protein CDEST_02464 [Colletotrichum destructivum]|uniref:Uncharacterized protein n=1 Tax=Colletotrichum destructivum TaxID=34406 RepID=A0AAX4I2I0_9PEZI|nr:hypothetical protein CDEST_02464 [Colletotrichum destructivum]
MTNHASQTADSPSGRSAQAIRLWIPVIEHEKAIKREQKRADGLEADNCLLRERLEMTRTGGFYLWPFGRIDQQADNQTAGIGEMQAENFRLRQQLEKQTSSIDAYIKGQEQAKTRVSELEKKNSSLGRQVKKVQAGVCELEENNSQLKRQVEKGQKDYENDIKQHANYINKLQHKIKVLKEQVAARDVVNAGSQRIANASKVSDDAILAIWNQMAYNVRSIVASLLTHCPSKEEVVRVVRLVPCRVSKLIKADFALVQNDDIRSSIVERHLWLAVSDVIDGDSCDQSMDVWGGLAGTHLQLAFRALLGSQNKDAEALLRWKAEGSGMIEKITGVDKKALGRLAQEQTHAFSVFMPRDKQKDLLAVKGLCEDLEKIFDLAVQLHSIFMCSRAHFEIRWVHDLSRSKNKKLFYRAESMDAEAWEVELNENSVVYFGISPGLLKFGTANGVDYDKSKLLVKDRVVCK